VSKTHWATRPRQSSLSTAACSASSQATSTDFKSRVAVSIQLNLGLPGLLLVHESICHRMACFGTVHILSSSMCMEVRLLSIVQIYIRVAHYQKISNALSTSRQYFAKKYVFS